ncbi:restriction endonuclease subunit S [uncultured Methanobrevibacter sp.]|uniref:restriction endonuclease subunit S n=1 Tax=uncultured Methanobrevibacter sp. TaxID=253161 RepID=UPI0025F990E9|nr:restriction endonuclease subunit S [uncultured Methanobrevibacter sp.]
MRFIEETWSSEKLGNLCKITMGQSPSSKNYSKNSNDTILIQGNADLISGKIVPRIYTSEITKLSYPGDIILTVRAPVGDLAINEFDSCIGRGVCSIKGNKFIYYYLESLKDKHVWERLSQGSTFESVNSNDIKNLNLKIPSNSTQNHIINFFTAIDTKIELLQKKHGEYIRFKQYLMQNIFADKSAEKLRFNFTDDWKQYKLKDVLTVKSSSISINQLEENTGDYPLYGASGFLKNIDFCEMDVDYISIVKDGSGVGNLSFHEKNSSIVNTSQYLLPKKNFNINFLYYLLQTINLMKYVNGSSIPHIYFKDYCIEKINIPSLDEQEKIGKLFVDVDITMENLNKNINATQEFKKGLLQQMFVVQLILSLLQNKKHI